MVSAERVATQLHIMPTLITRIAPDVGWLPVSFANIYFIGRPGGKWIVVDAGLPGQAKEIVAAAEARFGAGSRPEAVVLTHGHMDQVGSALPLAAAWDVPIYAHHLELPYLTGKSMYPPADPTVGGALAFLSRFFPAWSRDLSGRIHELHRDKVPGAVKWTWLPTPGHSPGHISLFRESDRVLIAGDAFTTVNMDSWSGLVTAKQRLSRPPTPYTCDWNAARSSVKQLASLRPNTVGCSHGIPISHSDLPERMQAFANKFRPPKNGRYSRHAALTDENGIVDLPKAPFDPVPFATAGALLCVGIAIGAGYFDDNQRR
jgi:glyoxylase-like metal-dependent hydrolase (beta-lactamase superfamily II)